MLGLTRSKCKHSDGFSGRGQGDDQSSPSGEVLSKDGDGGQEGEAVAKACEQTG